MVFGKILFDAAGVAALAYLTCGPAAQIVLHRPEPADVQAAMAVPEQAAPAARTPVRRADDGLFYIWCEVNGTPVRFLVDTGASVVVLTPEDARRAGVQSNGGAGGRLQTASGSAAMRWARLASISVAGQEVRNLDAAVVTRGLRVSLLGQNLLTRMGTVSIDGNELHLR